MGDDFDVSRSSYIDRAMTAMFQMKKLDIAALYAAADQKSSG